MGWFAILLAVTVVVRGFGAGIIYDVAFVSLPLRRKLGSVFYAKYALANFKGIGIRTYAPVSILGLLLTIAVTVLTFVAGNLPAVNWSIAAAMLATVIAFLGTARALPALISLRKAGENEAQLTEALDKFSRWHQFSAAWQVISFIALAAGLAMVG